MVDFDRIQVLSLQPMSNQKLLAVALDLTRFAPRSARDSLGGYGAVAARTLDKCRAELAGRAGSYHYNCPLDQVFFRFTGIDPEEFKEFVATGVSDEEVARWIEEKSKVRDAKRVLTWSRRFHLNPLLRLLDFDDWLHARYNRP